MDLLVLGAIGPVWLFLFTALFVLWSVFAIRGRRLVELPGSPDEATTKKLIACEAFLRLIPSLAIRLGFLGTVMGMMVTFVRLLKGGDLGDIDWNGLATAMGTTVGGILLEAVLQLASVNVLSDIGFRLEMTTVEEPAPRQVAPANATTDPVGVEPVGELAQ